MEDFKPMKIKAKGKAIFYHRFDGGIMGECAFDLAGGKPVAGICRVWGRPDLIHQVEWILWGRHISEILKTKPNILAKIMVGTDLPKVER